MNIKRLNHELKSISPDVHAYREDGVLHIEGCCSSYQDVVSCGVLGTHVKSRGVVNDAVSSDVAEKPMRVSLSSDKSLEGKHFDVVIIGAGVVGCAIAMELSHLNISVAVLEKEYDVATRASSRNDGMIHPGIDLHRNQKKTYFNCRGNRLYGPLSEKLGFKFVRNGSYVVFDRWWNLLTVPFFHLRARQNDVDGIRFVSRKRLAQLEKSVASWQKGAMFFPSSGIVQPYEVTVAFAENASDNGTSFFFETAVLDVRRDEDKVRQIVTNRGSLECDVVVNAAGVYSDRIAAMAGDRFFTIHPRKGTEFIMDKELGSITSSVLAKVPFSDVAKGHTKGGGVVRTIDGNILVGPDAFETVLREDDSTDASNVQAIFDKHHKTVPSLDSRMIITYFSGTRACTYEEDFVVQKSDRVSNMLHAAGIQSPGLTAAPAIAKKIAEDVISVFSTVYGKNVTARDDALLTRRRPIVVSELDSSERDSLIHDNPDYGQIVCRCEQVSLGEILDALHTSLPIYNIDAVKRRCRCGMGRCQGGFCSPQIAAILASEMKCDISEVHKGLGTFVQGKVKEGH